MPKEELKDSDYFDVAKWSRGDIKTQIRDSFISKDFEVTDGEDLETFVTAVIDELENTFDASVGINWDGISNAIDTVALDTRFQ